MGKKIVTLYTDDVTVEEIPEDKAKELPLRIGSDEWKLIVTDDSEAQIRQLIEPFTNGAEYKNHAPKGTQPAADITDEKISNVINLQPDNSTLRAWWSSLKTPQLRAVGLSAPTGNRGRVPQAVRDAYMAAHMP